MKIIKKFALPLTALFAVFIYVNVYQPFNKPVALPSGWTKDKAFVFPQAGRALWIDAIGQAEKSIDIAAYKLSDPQIIDALSKARKKGVKINLLIEPQVFQHTQSGNAVSPMEQLKAIGINVHTLSKRFNQAHYKMLIVDDLWGLISTGNLDTETFDGLREISAEPCRDFAVPVFDASTIKEMKRIFDADINDKRIVPEHADLVWGPDQQRSTFLRLINSAKKKIWIYQQDFQDVGIAQAVAGAAKSGVDVRVIMMPFPFSKTEDKNILNQEIMTKAGGQVRLQQTNYIHAKVIVVDDQEMYIGSGNFYPASIDQTRELGILIKNTNQIKIITETFTADWGISKPFVAPAAEKKVELVS
jgi:cardiolipin synthase